MLRDLSEARSSEKTRRVAKVFLGTSETYGLQVIKAQLGIETLEVVSAAEEHPLGYDQQRDAAGPAKPQIVFLADQLESVTA